MARKQLQCGFIVENGIRAQLNYYSFFSPKSCAVLQFDYRQLWEYKEVEAIRCNTRLDDFCFPPTAEYEIVKEEEKIVIRIFAKEMPESPVLEWEFPSPSEETETAYNVFLGAKVIQDCRQCAYNNDPDNCALSIGKLGECLGFTTR